MTAAFTVVRANVGTAVVFDSPHSGRDYPDDFVSSASRLELRRGEDAYVDDLLANAPSLGATLLTATFPRCYIDVNREVDDIDASLLAEPWPEPLHPTEKTARGLGLIRRFVVPGVEAQGNPLSVRDVRRRIDSVYRPYHDALRALIDGTLRMHGTVCHVNWHSMKSIGNAMTPDGAGARRADFVVSDVRGASASPHVTSLIVETLRASGYSVSVNDPYLGGTIVKRVGDPSRGVHSVQVEINRRLYLDEVRVEKTGGFDRLRADIDALTRTLVAASTSSNR